MTEQQRFSVVSTFPGFELRRYEPCVVAEVEVDGSLEAAGNRAFRRLIGYIGGRNRAGRSLAMTAPVVQEQAGRRIAMTAPVVQEEHGGRHVVGFVMPAGETLETLPEPTDAAVTLRALPEEVAAAVRYSGRWTGSGYRQRVTQLEDAVARAGLTITGPPRWARFDPPWTPWFLRHNEVVLPVAEPG
ncbi:MAG TPA: heme-binding protein [Phycicoccus sp.]